MWMLRVSHSSLCRAEACWRAPSGWASARMKQCVQFSCLSAGELRLRCRPRRAWPPQAQDLGCCAQAPRAEETAALRGQLADLQRDNGILKRAVAIQNARLQVCIPRWGFCYLKLVQP